MRRSGPRISARSRLRKPRRVAGAVSARAFSAAVCSPVKRSTNRSDVEQVEHAATRMVTISSSDAGGVKRRHRRKRTRRLPDGGHAGREPERGVSSRSAPRGGVHLTATSAARESGSPSRRRNIAHGSLIGTAQHDADCGKIAGTGGAPRLMSARHRRAIQVGELQSGTRRERSLSAFE